MTGDTFDQDTCHVLLQFHAIKVKVNLKDKLVIEKWYSNAEELSSNQPTSHLTHLSQAPPLILRAISSSPRHDKNRLLCEAYHGDKDVFIKTWGLDIIDVHLQFAICIQFIQFIWFIFTKITTLWQHALNKPWRDIFSVGIIPNKRRILNKKTCV